METILVCADVPLLHGQLKALMAPRGRPNATVTSAIWNCLTPVISPSIRRVPRTPSPLLTRLRRHHGAWGLCVFVLLFKLVTGAVCLADVPHTPAPSKADVALMQVSVDLAQDGGDCLLGEAAGCHCACAHAVPLTGLSTRNAAALNSGFEPPFISSGYQPAPPGSLLRPPIA